MKVASIRTRDKRRFEPAERIEGVSASLLQTHSRLGGLPSAKLARLAQRSECQLIPAGNTIFRQHDDADAVYMLLDGSIELERREADGYASTHSVYGPFASFGDVALIGESSRYYTANANSESIVIRTPMGVLREVLAANPDLARAWIQAVSAELQRQQRRLAGSIQQHIASPAFFDAA